MIVKILRELGYGWVPTAAGASILIGLVVPYIIAVRSNHVYYLLPWVSDTGALQPESCVFGQMLNVGSILVGATMYLRYRQIVQQSNVISSKVLKWNSLSVIPGSLAVLGLSILANFQEDLHHPESLQNAIHAGGAVTCFVFGVVYGYFHSRISYALSTEFWSRAMAVLRFTLTALTGIFLVITLGLASVAFEEFNGTFAEHMQWRPEDKGYDIHIISAIAEYLMSLTYVIFILTYYDELRTIKQIRDLFCPAKSKMSPTDYSK
ncbi:DNA damage-regulated autophagy modulator protein 2-like [Patiria miniata]|uniref:CWH43-like N-terminal domain-containing protein n=1 Tax=Patiria miniata TaxID=46514 RepID=A0A913ZP58_PATMI|nr:DNA damage-regulated autophagy modulator protein 2-like [Patiria miniata]